MATRLKALWFTIAMAISRASLKGCIGTGGADGTVYRLSPPAGGSGLWTETKLHDFCIGCTNGSVPESGLIFDSQGNLYGTTLNGVDEGGGVAYELSPPAGGQGQRTETVLQTFCPQCLIGYEPLSGLIFDSRGNLLGTTNSGGTTNNGVAYELSPPTGGQGQWTETVLYNFCRQYPCPDGANPQANLILDSAGVPALRLLAAGGARTFVSHPA